MPDAPEKPELRPAATNPWYVLMTVAGEPISDQFYGHRVWNLHARNRRFWNDWQAKTLNDEQKAKLVEAGRATIAELAPLTDGECAAIDEALRERCPDAEKPDAETRPNLRFTEFRKSFLAVGFLFF